MYEFFIFGSILLMILFFYFFFCILSVETFKYFPDIYIFQYFCLYVRMTFDKYIISLCKFSFSIHSLWFYVYFVSCFYSVYAPVCFHFHFIWVCITEVCLFFSQYNTSWSWYLDHPIFSIWGIKGIHVVCYWQVQYFTAIYSSLSLGGLASFYIL